MNVGIHFGVLTYWPPFLYVQGAGAEGDSANIVDHVQQLVTGITRCTLQYVLLSSGVQRKDVDVVKCPCTRLHAWNTHTPRPNSAQAHFPRHV